MHVVSSLFMGLLHRVSTYYQTRHKVVCLCRNICSKADNLRPPPHPSHEVKGKLMREAGWYNIIMKQNVNSRVRRSEAAR